jgi:hypothetical protein
VASSAKTGYDEAPAVLYQQHHQYHDSFSFRVATGEKTSRAVFQYVLSASCWLLADDALLLLRRDDHPTVLSVSD